MLQFVIKHISRAWSKSGKEAVCWHRLVFPWSTTNLLGGKQGSRGVNSATKWTSSEQGCQWDALSIFFPVTALETPLSELDVDASVGTVHARPCPWTLTHYYSKNKANLFSKSLASASFYSMQKYAAHSVLPTLAKVPLTVHESNKWGRSRGSTISCTYGVMHMAERRVAPLSQPL